MNVKLCITTSIGTSELTIEDTTLKGAQAIINQTIHLLQPASVPIEKEVEETKVPEEKTSSKGTEQQPTKHDTPSPKTPPKMSNPIRGYQAYYNCVCGGRGKRYVMKGTKSIQCHTCRREQVLLQVNPDFSADTFGNFYVNERFKQNQADRLAHVASKQAKETKAEETIVEETTSHSSGLELVYETEVETPLVTDHWKKLKEAYEKLK